MGLIVGLWFGINIGKDRTIFANPFEERAFTQKVKNSAEDMVHDTKEAIRESLDDR
jgi:hypothetical protein